MAKNETTPTAAPALERKTHLTPAELVHMAYPSTKRMAGARVVAEIPHPDLWQHEAAAALHGWADHAHHEGRAIQLTPEEYFGALKAATEPAKDGNYLAHLPALSRHGHVAKQLAAYVPSVPAPKS